jgi:hypothetical protein
VVILPVGRAEPLRKSGVRRKDSREGRFAGLFHVRAGHWICGLAPTPNSERATRWLIALMVLCCDPLPIALTAAASAKG